MAPTATIARNNPIETPMFRDGRIIYIRVTGDWRTLAVVPARSSAAATLNAYARDNRTDYAKISVAVADWADDNQASMIVQDHDGTFTTLRAHLNPEQDNS